MVVGVGPNVAQDEGRVHKRFTGKGFVAGPRHDAAHTARGHGKVRRAVERLHTVGLVSADVEVGFTHPGHVGDLTEDGGDLVDGAVLVVFGQDVTEVLGERAVLNRVAGRRGVVLANEGAHANMACWSKEGIASFFVGVHEADRDPVGVCVEVFAGFARESVALDKEPHVLEGLSVVGKGHLTGHLSAGVELQDLDHGVGLSVAVLGVDVIVVVRKDEVVHHRAGKRQGLGHEGPRRAALAKVLRRLRVGAVAVHAKRGCTVADVGSGHHGVKELGRVVGSYVDDLHRVNFRTRLLIEHVLPNGFVNLFTRHFVGEGTALGLVHLRHEGGRVLTGQDGRGGEDAHGLSRVVLGVGRVSAGAWVEAVVDSEVADFVVTLNRLAGSTVVVLHRIGALQTDDVGVEVHDLCFGQSVDQELDGHGQTGVGTVNVRRDRIELLGEICSVPVVAKHVVGHFERGVRGQSNVVVERAVGVFLRQEVRTITRTGEALGTGEDLAVLPEAPSHVVAGGAVVVELVTFGHDGVPVGLRHAERGVQDLNGKGHLTLLTVDDPGLVTVFCAVVDVDQCGVLGVAEVVLQHRIKWRGEF